MANRFLDTNYYRSPFVRGLEGPLKALYSFIICDCDGAGIWTVDLEIACVYIGFKISEDQFQTNFIDTGKAVPIGQNRFFFPDFIEHQYPQGLMAGNRAHKNFIDKLKKFDLIDENLRVKTKGLQRGIEGASKDRRWRPCLGNGNVLGIGNSLTKEEEYINTNVLTTEVAPEEKIVEIKGDTDEQVSDSAKKNSKPKKKVARKKKGRDPDAEPYWHILRRSWVDFNLKHLHFKVEPIPEMDYSFMHRIIEKLRERATDQGVPWIEQEAVKRWEKFLTTAYTGDKWLHDHFEMKNLTTQMQSIFKILENGRSNASVVGKTITFDKP